ncbi:glycosyl transferase [Geomonas limicola]|uniref:Glycosyl transferase n=1 Tax=Geomonas limicola TaxID=2740186 RepID=A0A6V8N3J6_9BACT|nr:glycosyltransferase family 39 protein [Geomonas limicola]GFO67021.1 glycosyl transferase [Geomonas limicola]
MISPFNGLMRYLRQETETLLRDLGLLAIVFGTLFFQGLGNLPLIDPDEGRYIEIPREMLLRHDFVTPLLNGVKYFEKPPLLYWLNALSLTLFGENEFAARFAGTLCGLLTVLVTYYLGRRLMGRRVGLYAAVILGSSAGFMVQSRINFTDMILSFLLTCAFGCFALAQREEERQKGLWYYLFYISMGLAVLAKGLIGIVLPGAVIFLYLLLANRWRLLKEMRLFSGALLFFAVCAPWFVLVSLRNPEFAQFFFIHEHFQRFLTKVHHRYQPVWFFFPVLLATMLPWAPLIPAALKRGWTERRSTGATLFLVLWAVVIFAFFSKSSSKLIPYILPVFPPLALLIGSWLERGSSTRSMRWHAVGIGILLLALGGAAIAYPLTFPKPEIGVPEGVLVGGLFLCQGVAALLSGFRGEPVRFLATMAISAYFFCLIAPPVIYARMIPEVANKEFSQVINQKAGPEVRIACYSGYEQGIAFYTHRRVIVVGDPDELSFGRDQGGHAEWFLDYDAFHKLWDSGTPLFTVIKQRDLPKLQAAVKTPITLVTQVGRRLLVSNRPVETGQAPQKK